MSADAATLPCPVCSHSGIFGTVEALRDKLISVSTNSILCPVCQEEVIGLDKLTIHLFSHVKVLAKTSNSDKVNTKTCDVSEKRQPKKSRPSQPAAKNKNSSLTSNTPVKFVKIYPKLPVLSLNTVPIIEMSPEKNAEGYVQNKNSIYVSTVKTDVKLGSSDTTCTVCGLQFVDSHILKMHRCLIHNIDENSNQSCTRYNCHLCPKHFKMRGSLMVHLRVAHYGFSAAANNAEPNTDENTNIKSQNLDNVSVIIEKSDNKQWQCDVCRKCFTTKYFLKKHKRLHTGETPYACTQCNKTFTFQQSYHKHLLYHNDEKPHSCSYCGRAFKELSTLHNHQRIHTGEKPFSCETCGKCFRQRVSYLVHRRIHTGVMPYKCTACDKSFRYKVSQRTHKCQAQPPGTVVRQTGDLIEKLKQKHVETSPVSMEPENAKNGIQDLNVQITTIPDNYPEVSEANAELVRKGAELSLEDMESENFNIIADTFKENTEQMPGTSDIVQTPAKLKDIDIYESNLDELINSIPVIEKNVPSPSEILKNLCLSSDEDLVGILQETDEIQHNDVSKEFNIFL